MNDLGLKIHGDPAGLVGDRDQIRVDVLLADLDPFGQPNAFFLELSPNRMTQRVERRAQRYCSHRPPVLSAERRDREPATP